MTLPPRHPLDPYCCPRAVDAFWVRITELADRGATHCSLDNDARIQRGWAYLRQLRACRLDRDRDKVARDFPDIDAAYRLHTTVNKLERVVVEARLLARQSVAAIAAATGLPVDAVVAYEALFFQVFGRLDATGFILARAIGVNLWDNSLRESDTDILLKLFAYQGGVKFFEEALRYFQNGLQVPEHLEQASRAELEEVVVMLRVRAVILSKVLPYPKCMRAFPLHDLADDFKAYLDLFPQGVGHPYDADDILAKVGVSPCAGDLLRYVADMSSRVPSPVWWPSFRAVVLAA